MKILHLNASTRGAESQSLAVANLFVSDLRSKISTPLKVDECRLFEEKLPAFSGSAVGAKMAVFTGVNATDEQKAVWTEMRAIFDRFAAADAYVLNVPLWNNGIPYVLKQYIDIVTQPGWTFGFDMEKGYTGLMQNKRALVVHAGGVYYEGIRNGFGADFSTPYLDEWFKLIGVNDVNHIHVSPSVVNPDFEKTKTQAQASARDLAGRWASTLK